MSNPPTYTNAYADPYTTDGIHTNVDPAVINVEIANGIKDITDPLTSPPLCSNAEFTMLYGGSNQPAVSLSGSGTDSKIIIAKGTETPPLPCYIDYVFDNTWNLVSTNPPRDWRPVGIAFKKTDNTGRGDINLPMMEIRMYPPGLQRGGSNGPVRAGSTLRIKDTRQNPGEWNYWLLVQDSAGRIGMIDPEIQNEQ